MIQSRNPILITGSHRSGSTWVGQMLSIGSNVNYIHEPFNLEPKCVRKPIRYWFEHVSQEDSLERQGLYLGYMNSLISLKVKDFTVELAKTLLQGRLRPHLGSMKNRLLKRQLIKDPIAIFSADWLSKKFDMNVLVMVRHPAAFVASLKVKSWYHDFDHFIQQPSLMKLLPEYFRDEITDIVIRKKDIIDHGILLWNIIHYQIIEYQQKYPEWIFVRHEDISQDPVMMFRTLYNKLKLNYTDIVEHRILNSSSVDQGEFQRNSRKNIKSWKTRLNKKEIDKIRCGTSKYWQVFYDESDW